MALAHPDEFVALKKGAPGLHQGSPFTKECLFVGVKVDSAMMFMLHRVKSQEMLSW